MKLTDLISDENILNHADPVERIKLALTALKGARRERELLELREFLDWMLMWRRDLEPKFPHPSYSLPGVNQHRVKRGIQECGGSVSTDITYIVSRRTHTVTNFNNVFYATETDYRPLCIDFRGWEMEASIRFDQSAIRSLLAALAQPGPTDATG
jgi:hypothetical protein